MQVDPEYIEQIKIAVDAIHKFVDSGFKKKDFPMIDEDNSEELEPCLFHMLTWFNRIDPSWFHDGSRVDDALDEIRDLPQKYGRSSDIMDALSDENDDKSMDKLYAYIGYQMTQFIDSHKSDFYQLLDGISQFTLFTTPSKYQKALSIFSEPLSLNDIRDIIGNNEFYIFNEEDYVKGIFHTDRIVLSKQFTLEKEMKRFKDHRDLTLHVSFEDLDNDMIQEQAEINFFSMVNPNHIRYHQNRFQPSQQFVSVIKKLIAGLRTCNTPDDVKNWLNDKTNRVNPDDYTSMVLPSILARVFSDEKQFQNRLFNEKNLKKYMDSYESIMKQDKNVVRFKDYDLFSTFKADKDGTIQFLEDFLSLKLVSDQNAYISNHTLLVLFNIFDSRIYLDILYNVLPQSEKKGEYETEDGFVKAIRARINENSNKSSPYTKPEKHTDPSVMAPTSSQVSEYASQMIRSLGDFDTSDYPYIYKVMQEACYLDISTLSDKAYNKGYSHDILYDYIQESQGYDFEGKIPSYMSERIKNTEKPDIAVEDTPLPEGVPTNDIGDLIDSIDDRVDAVQPDEHGNIDFSDGFGADAEVSPKQKDSHIVYNITYNYHNSNNTTNTTTDSHNTVTRNNDLSINKTTGGTSNNRYRTGAKPKQNQGSNNYNNDTFSTNPKDQSSNTSSNHTTFSTGKSVQEVFSLLRSEEPLFVREGAEKMAASLVNSAGTDLGLLPDTNKPPKESLAVKAQDFDRETLAKQQKALKGVQNARITAKAIGQPAERTKDWVTKQVDQIIAKDEEEQKRRMLEDPNYRTMVKKVFRFACDLGLYSVAFAVAPTLGFLCLGKKALDLGNQSRMKDEMQREFITEIQIIDDKIARAKAKRNAEGEREMHELMRIRAKMVEKATRLTTGNIRKQGIITQNRRNSYGNYYDYDY